MQSRIDKFDVLRLSASIAAIYTFCLLAGSPAFGQEDNRCPLSPPSEDGVLQLRRADGKFISVTPGFRAPFGKILQLCFGIPPLWRNTQGPGLVATKVVKLYTAGKEATEGDSRRTYLYRGSPENVDIPGMRRPFEGHVTRELFRKYHLNETENLTLRNRFHTQYGEAVSNGTENIRRKFLFDAALPNIPEHFLQKAFLFHYRGTGDNGTWIPFHIATDGPFDRVLIWSFDLGAIKNGELAEYAWQIGRQVSR